MFSSFILGLSTGSACLITCGMVLFPYMMAGSAGVRRITTDLVVFLLSRMVAYFLIATLAWYVGKSFLQNPVIREIIPGIMYIIFASMLLWYSIDTVRRPHCPAKFIVKLENRKLIPLVLGLVNSFGFCPALYIVITEGAVRNSLADSYLSFLAFFIGSSLWFLPLPLAGKIGKKQIIEKIGILATGLASIIFIIKGITMIIGGLLNG